MEYFGFYLLHNVYENSVHVYEDPRWGIVDYFIEQKSGAESSIWAFPAMPTCPV